VRRRTQRSRAPISRVVRLRIAACPHAALTLRAYRCTLRRCSDKAAPGALAAAAAAAGLRVSDAFDAEQSLTRMMEAEDRRWRADAAPMHSPVSYLASLQAQLPGAMRSRRHSARAPLSASLALPVLPTPDARERERAMADACACGDGAHVSRACEPGAAATAAAAARDASPSLSVASTAPLPAAFLPPAMTAAELAALASDPDALKNFSVGFGATGARALLRKGHSHRCGGLARTCVCGDTACARV
jgi:hypothetical protein